MSGAGRAPTVAVLDQDVPTGFDGTIFDVVAEGLGPKGRALAEHDRICKQLETVNTPELVKRRDELQNRLNSDNGWEFLRQVESILFRTRLDTEKKFTDLSAGGLVLTSATNFKIPV